MLTTRRPELLLQLRSLIDLTIDQIDDLLRELREQSAVACRERNTDKYSVCSIQILIGNGTLLSMRKLAEQCTEEDVSLALQDTRERTLNLMVYLKAIRDAASDRYGRYCKIG